MLGDIVNSCPILSKCSIGCVCSIIVYSTAHAYVIYTTEHAAMEAYECAKLYPVELDDRTLTVMRYMEPPMHVPPGNCSYLTGLHYAKWG